MTCRHIRQTTMRSTRVRSRRQRVRICARPERPCAQADARAANEDGTCPFVHTLTYGVCEVGHVAGKMAALLSVCAHGTLGRVQSRTRERPYRAVPVRLCTRDVAACAKSDT